MSEAYAAKHTDIALGLGKWVIAHGIYKGTPAIIFTPAKTPGEPDTDATGEIPTDRVSEGAIVLRFTTMEAACRHLDRIKSMMQTFQAAMMDPQP